MVKQQDTFGTNLKDDIEEDRDDKSVGASSGGIRPYSKSKSKSSRKSSFKGQRNASDYHSNNLNNPSISIKNQVAMSATKEDSFQLEVHRINATSIKTFSASKLSKSESKQ